MMTRFVADERGSTAVEYALLASLIAMGLVAALNLIALYLDTQFTAVSDAAS